MKKEITLDLLEIGSGGTIKAVGGEGPIRKRLLDLGLTPKTFVKLIKTAPMGDPLELHLRGYNLTLRKAEAEKVVVEVEE